MMIFGGNRLTIPSAQKVKDEKVCVDCVEKHPLDIMK